MFRGLPRLLVMLAVLSLFALGCFSIVQGLFSMFGDETAHRVVHIFIADLNADGSQDVFLVTNQMHRIAFNDGQGNFTSSRELFMRNYALSLGDLNGNGSLDAILVNFENGEMGGELITECAEVPDSFVSPVLAPGAPAQVFAFQDGNKDGIPENFIAGCCGGGTSMINYATLFSERRSCLGLGHPTNAALGDLNGDGTLDAFLVNAWILVNGDIQRNAPNEVWFNDGQGNFSDSGQRLGDAESYAVALGDLNRDGSLDAVVGNSNGSEIWFNDGQGIFTRGKRNFGSKINTIFVGDLDNDGDLDLFMGGNNSMRVWLNDGDGKFKSGQRINFDRYDAVAVGDVTGDGIHDVFIGGPSYYQVWRGIGNGRFNAGERLAYR
jgi:hypothetical protein